MQTRFSVSFWSLLMGLFLVPLACVDQEFDQPPVGGNDPNIPVNISIAEIKATHTLDAYEEITEDWTFSGIVISDDAEGNFFKQLVIQDSTGGIEMRIEMTNLSNVYPVGRKVYVKAKGLYLGDYNGLIQLGAGIGTGNNGDPELIRIPESILGQYIVTATYGNPTPPKVITIDQLDVSDVSTLVQFDNVQFIGSDAGQTYADAVLQQSLNREIEDCAKRRVIIRTSGFATFAGDTTPTKNGTLVGVLGIFGDDFQLMLRDLDDVNMTGDRCGVGNVVTIETIRNQFTGSQTTLTGGTIRGVVISDFSSASVTGRNLYIQDATGGIVLRFDANHSFALGSEILVDLSGGLLGEFNGLLQVDGLTLGAASLESIPGDVTPRTATVAEVLANAQAWESTLVEIKDATLSGTTTYNGSVTVTDASGAMILFTRSQATFSGDPIPSGQVTIKAILSEFNSPQLIIRNKNDVTGGGSGGGDEFSLAEIRQMFASGTTAAPNGTIQGVVISDHTTMSVTGRNAYIQDATGGIVVRFTQNHTFPLGAELKITISGGILSEFNGLLQIDGIASNAASTVGTPGDVVPRMATIQEVLSNLEAWESTLVRMTNVSLSGNTVYNGAVTLSDGTGTIDMFTRSQATFAQDAIPSGVVTLTGIVSQFTNPQIIIRSTSDIQ